MSILIIILIVITILIIILITGVDAIYIMHWDHGKKRKDKIKHLKEWLGITHTSYYHYHYHYNHYYHL